LPHPATPYRHVVLLVLLVFTSACGGRGCGSGTSGPGSSSRREPRIAAAADLTEAERAWGVAPVPSPSVTYQPDVVMVGGGPAAVRGMSPDGLTWTLDGGAERAGEIVPGKIVFVTGRVVGRVLGVTRQSGTVAVVLGPVELTDVIKEAAISVRQPVDFSKALVYTQNDPVGASTPVDPIAQATEPGPAGARPVLASYPARDGPWPPDGAIVSSPVVVYGEPQGGYVRTQSGQPVTVRKFTVYPVMGSDGIGLHMSSDADGIRLTGDVRLRLAQPTLNFDLDIKGGKIRKALVRLDGAAGLLLKFEAGSEKGFSANVNERIVVPVDFSLPITGLSVPFAVTVRQQFIIKTAFSGTTGLKATGDYSFGGSFSAGYQNGKFEIGGPTGFSVKESLLKSASGVSLAPIGLVLAHQTRVIVGIGAFGFVTGPFFGFNSSVGVSQTGATSAMLLNCKQATLTVGLVAGIGYSMPQPVTNVINFFLRKLNLGEIKSYGGIDSTPLEIIKSTGTEPPTKACGA